MTSGDRFAAGVVLIGAFLIGLAVFLRWSESESGAAESGVEKGWGIVALLLAASLVIYSLGKFLRLTVVAGFGSVPLLACWALSAIGLSQTLGADRNVGNGVWLLLAGTFVAVSGWFLTSDATSGP